MRTTLMTRVPIWPAESNRQQKSRRRVLQETSTHQVQSTSRTCFLQGRWQLRLWRRAGHAPAMAPKKVSQHVVKRRAAIRNWMSLQGLMALSARNQRAYAKTRRLEKKGFSEKKQLKTWRKSLLKATHVNYAELVDDAISDYDVYFPEQEHHDSIDQPAIENDAMY